MTGVASNAPVPTAGTPEYGSSINTQDGRSLVVTIIGAGPSGLMCALVLAQHGVQVRILEANLTPITQTRAMFIQPRTLELWDRVGLSGAALERGSRVNTISMWRDGREVSRLSITEALAAESKFPFALGLPQDQTQAMLLAALEAFPNCQISWNARLTELRQRLDTVELTFQGPRGTETWISDYVVGADGGRSTVRTLLGITMVGSTYPLAEVGGDVDLPPGLPRDAMISSSSAARGLSVMPIGGKRFRVFGTLTPELATQLGFKNDASQLRLEDFTAWFKSVFPNQPSPTKLHRAFAYRIHKRVAERFREHRVFLIGDAAHMNPPAGGQGINLGMGDGFNLGWKLALVCQGQAYPTLLDTYEAERAPLARTIVNAVDLAYQADSMDAGASRLLAPISTTLTRLLIRLPLIRTWIVRHIAQMWISYRASANDADHGPRDGLRVGDRVPMLPQLETFGVNSLQFHLLVFDGTRREDVVDVSPISDMLTAALRPFHLPINVQRVGAHQRALHRRFGATQGLFVLIRPDGHILFRGQTEDDIRALLNMLRRWFVVDTVDASARANATADLPQTSDVFQAGHSAISIG